MIAAPVVWWLQKAPGGFLQEYLENFRRRRAGTATSRDCMNNTGTQLHGEEMILSTFK
jgi:hypothetical protein